MEYLEFIISLALMILGANVLVSGSVVIARHFHVSPLLIGLLVIGFGTSLPEFSTSFLSMLRGQSDLAVGNVVGSNIANSLLVLGIAAVLRPIPIHYDSFERDASFLVLTNFILLICLWQRHISWELGLLMCMTLVFYINQAYRTDREHVKKNVIPVPYVALSKRISISTTLAVVATISGLILTLLGAHYLLESVLIIFGHWGFSEVMIGLSVVAFGTSLPELTTAIVASLKKQSSVALGNVVGSNIYNALFILGVTALFRPVLVPNSVREDVVVMVVATSLLLLCGYVRKRISRGMGVLFLMLYFGYILYLGLQ